MDRNKSSKRKRGRPSKSPDELRSEDLLVKLQADEKTAFKDAAQIAGIPLSVWVRERLRRIAINELEEAAHPIAFLRR